MEVNAKKDLLLKEIENMPDVFIEEILDYVQFLKMKLSKEKLGILILSGGTIPISHLVVISPLTTCARCAVTPQYVGHMVHLDAAPKSQHRCGYQVLQRRSKVVIVKVWPSQVSGFSRGLPALTGRR